MTSKKAKTKPKATPKAKPEETKTTQEEPTLIRDVGRYHQLGWGGGQITVPKEMVPVLDLSNKDKLMLVAKEGELIVTKLN